MKPVDPKTKTQASSDPVSTAKTVQLGIGEKHPLSGQVLGTYEIVDVLGKGGMGVVFRAKDKSLDRVVALKVLAPELSGDEGYVERFLREARAAAKLDHPNVVQVHAAGQTQSYCWMAMQYAKGVPLSGHLRQGRKFTVTESLQVVRQVALALGAAHEAGIIHRDIKPSNIMLDETGRALVMDFGLSRGIATGERITRTGTYLGTPEYSSPEQCETNDLDGRSDLYSLGVVFYEMLTGRVPHVAETPLALFRKIAEERPTPVTAINKQVPASVQALLDRMIAKDRERRYATAEDVVRDIDKVLKGQSLPAAPRAGGLLAEWKRVCLVAGLAAVILVAGISVWKKWPVTVVNPDPFPPVNGSGGSAVVEPERIGTKVVVLDFKDLKGDKETAWMEVGIPELLLGQLDALLQGNVVPREELLETMGRVVGKKVNADQGDARLALGKDLADVVARVDGRLVITGTYLVNGNEIRVTANVYERKPGAELIRLDSCTANGSVDDLFALVDRLAETVAARSVRAMAPAPSTPSAPAAAAAPAPSTPPEASESLQQEASVELVVADELEGMRRAIDEMRDKAGRKVADAKNSAKLRSLLVGNRRARKDAEGGAAPPAGPVLGKTPEESAKREAEKGAGVQPPAAPEPKAPADDRIRGAQKGDQDAGEEESDTYLSVDDRVARMKRFFENLRACEEMDLMQQKALRNDAAFLESLCDEECADTLKQKYESWCESNQAPKQEAEPAK